MFSVKMDHLTIFVAVLSIVIWGPESVTVEGKTRKPVYWNSSNPLFRSAPTRLKHVAINDRLDIICPRRGRDEGEELFYYKLYLVSEEDYKRCNASNRDHRHRLITCDVPDREKKYTFYFQEISPSPFGIEYKPDQTYYVISTSDGSKSGIESLQGGVCTRMNMKLELRVHPEDTPIIDNKVIVGQKDDTSSVHDNTVRQHAQQPEVIIPNPPRNYPSVAIAPPGTPKNVAPPKKNEPVQKPLDEVPPTEADNNDSVGSNGLVIGVVLGACAVLFIVLLGFLGYKVYRRRRHMKKYQSPPMTPTRGATPLHQVTLLPISTPHGHHARIQSEHERHRTGTLSSHSDRPPPSYNESFLDNGGPVVAV
uniref:Ephrin RBD domain-containing protein n=1 Tax=Ciona savignyi TaxID=51511 RepID=H2Y6B4_CIOSA